MAKKIFVTYKYSDADVLSLNPFGTTTARDYVDRLQDLIDEEDHINKGEDDGTDLSDFKDETIASHLRDKIFDSSVTIIVISKGMKVSWQSDEDQWIPWEISYSLREHTREGRTSKPNALLAVVLPDRSGKYDYYMTEDACVYCHCTTYLTNTYFGIIKANIFNVKRPVFNDCTNHQPGNRVYTGYFSYIHSVKWPHFAQDINKYIDIALEINSHIDDYEISKTV